MMTDELAGIPAREDGIARLRAGVTGEHWIGTAHHLFSAAQRYVTSSMTLRDIGRQLAVEYLLAGSRALISIAR